MKSFRIVVAAVAAVLLAVAASAQIRGNARLSGKVVDEQGQPIQDVQVKAQMEGQTELWTGKSNNKGEWRINGLSDGRYRIEFLKEGLEPLRKTFEVVDERIAVMNVTLTKPVPMVDPTIEINAQLQRAVKLAQDSQFVDARKICEDIVAKMPELSQCHAFIGRMHVAENQPAKALEHVKKAMDQEPANVDHKLLLAELLIATGDKVEGKKILDSIEMKEVKDPYPFINSAIALINDGKAPEAVETLTKLLAQFPTTHEILYYRGRANLASSKFDDAKADFEKFLSVAPTSKEAAEAKKILDQMAKK